MLLPREDVLPLLRCPKTKQPLSRLPDGSLAPPSPPPVYRVYHGYPVLIEFDDSVLSEEEFVRAGLASPVERPTGGGLTGLVKRVVSPPHPATVANVEELCRRLREKQSKPLVLVVGGGTVGQGMQSLYDAPDIQLVAFDIYLSPYVQFVADAHSLPLPSETFDAVVIQAVLEHVLEPQRVVDEIFRVLKPEGLVYAETPFLQPVHEGPYDFTRFTESGHRWLFRHFELIRSGPVGGPGTQLVWAIDSFVRSVCRSRAAGKLAKLLFLWLRFFDRLVPERYAIDAASGFFFLGQKSQSVLSPKDVIRHYKGAQT